MSITWEALVSGELGKPFQWGGRGEDSYDCWGLILRAYALLGKPAPPSWSPEEEGEAASRECAAQFLGAEMAGPHWVPTQDPQPGDVVAMGSGGRVHHVGLVTPFGVMHTTRRHGVVIAKPVVLKAAGYTTLEHYRWEG